LYFCPVKRNPAVIECKRSPVWADGSLILEWRYTREISVLTENLFMDNEQDCRYLLSEAGKQAITDIHFNAVLKVIIKNQTF
jgi:hypothetical protein